MSNRKTVGMQSRPGQTEPMIIKAISLHQPWASMIAQGHKTIETRYWPTNHRGDLLIVSTKKPEIYGLLSGFALCIVEVVDCRPMYVEDQTQARCPWKNGLWSWLLSNVRPVQPFRVRGHQRMYDVEIEVSK